MKKTVITLAAIAVLGLAGCATPESDLTAPVPVAPAGSSSAEAPESPPAAPPVFKAQIHKGKGDKVLKFKATISEPLVMTTTWKGTDSNVIIAALDADGNEAELLVNTIGSYTGQTLFNEVSDDIVGLKITGDGNWTVKLTDISTVKTWNGVGKYTGKKDGLIGVVDVFGAADSVRFVSTAAESNVIADAFDSDGNEHLLVNEIGNFKGEYLVPNETRLIVVSSDGTWTLEKV